MKFDLHPPDANSTIRHIRNYLTGGNRGDRGFSLLSSLVSVQICFSAPIVLNALIVGALVNSSFAGGIVGAPAPFDKGGVKVANQALKENSNSFAAGYVFVAGFRPAELRGKIWAEIKKANPGIAEKAVWGAVDSNTATTVASQTAAVLRAHPEIKVVFAPYDEFARGVKLGAVEAGLADQIKVYSADVSTSDIQDMREEGSPWVATSATNPAVVGEVSLRAVALMIAGQDPGKVIEVSPVLITQEQLNKNNIKTIADLDAKLRGFGHSDQVIASWIASALK
jgi:ABC-type sugar transport system substrate-binding protein